MVPKVITILHKISLRNTQARHRQYSNHIIRNPIFAGTSEDFGETNLTRTEPDFVAGLEEGISRIFTGMPTTTKEVQVAASIMVRAT